MMASYTAKIESVDEIVVDVLKDDLLHVANEELRKAMHTVIAYYSVPGQYEDGKYDLEEE